MNLAFIKAMKMRRGECIFRTFQATYLRMVSRVFLILSFAPHFLLFIVLQVEDAATSSGLLGGGGIFSSQPGEDNNILLVQVQQQEKEKK